MPAAINGAACGSATFGDKRTAGVILRINRAARQLDMSVKTRSRWWEVLRARPPSSPKRKPVSESSHSLG